MGEAIAIAGSGKDPRNAISTVGMKKVKATISEKAAFAQARRTLRTSDVLMPSSEEKEHYENLATGVLKRSGGSRRDFLGHARNIEELEAAKYIWNHPKTLQHVRTSPLGVGKDAVKDKEDLAKKKKAGIVQFEQYSFTFGQKSYIVKTARYKNGHEKLYHIEQSKPPLRAGL